MARLGPRFWPQKSPLKSLCGSLCCVHSQERRHINFVLRAQNRVFGVGFQKVYVEKVCVLFRSPSYEHSVFTKLGFLWSEIPQYCWEFHDRLWEAFSGTTSEKRIVPSRTGGERILEMLGAFKRLQLSGLGYPSRTLQGNSRKNSESVSGVFPEFFRNFLRKVPAVLGV